MNGVKRRLQLNTVDIFGGRGEAARRLFSPACSSRSMYGNGVTFGPRFSLVLWDGITDSTEEECFSNALVGIRMLY